jgi:hypothetical protein
METFISYVVKLAWVLAFGAVLYGIDWLAQRGHFKKAKFSHEGKKREFNLENWNFYFRLFSIAVLIAVGLTACSESEPAPQPISVAAKYCPSMTEGSIDMPSQEERIKARNIELVANGHGISGNDARDNTVGGGGSPDGGMFLTGSFHFEFDANCQQIPEKSYVTLFSDERFPVTGGMTPDGKIGMGSIGGTSIEGSIVNGKLDAKIYHGDGKRHIYGVFNGGFELR